MSQLTPEQINELAAAPQFVMAGSQSVSERSADDVIKLDKFAAEKEAAEIVNSSGNPASGWGFLKPARAVPPSAAC